MKITTEQFLSQLGIKVGKQYMCNDNIIEVDKSRLCLWIWTNEYTKHTEGFNYLLNKEITPLPKYTLTEDEKAIVRSATMDSIKRNEMGVLTTHSGSMLFLKRSMFMFIQEGEEVSLDELRKCL